MSGRAAQFAHDFDIPHAYTDYRDLLARDDVDMVSVGTPPFAHAEATIAALEAGKHVFLRKTHGHERRRSPGHGRRRRPGRTRPRH